MGTTGTPATPSGFANASSFTWGSLESGTTWTFTAVYASGNTWTSAMLNDITASTSTTAALNGTNLRCSCSGADGMRGFRFKQVFRCDSLVQYVRATSDGLIYAYGGVITQVSSAYTGGTVYNPNPGYTAIDAYADANDGIYEIDWDGTTTQAASSIARSTNTFYTYTATFSASTITITRSGQATYSQTGTASRNTNTYTHCLGYFSTDACNLEFGQITITGAITV